MVKIYTDYGDEPEDEFIPLSDHLACMYYDLEMDSYEDDALFFDTTLAENITLLELGCGSGRIGRYLTNKNRNVTGIDISISMLKKGKEYALASMQFYAMDMTALAFNTTFNSVIIPYNSLNLLITKERIRRCLEGCRQYLQTGGLFIAQIFVPTKKFLSEKKKSFQFQIFDMQPNGRLIKEIKKEYHSESKVITVEERFRVRPVGPNTHSTDYNSKYTVAAYEIRDWLHLLETSGFSIIHCYEDLFNTPIYSTDSPCLVVVCE